MEQSRTAARQLQTLGDLLAAPGVPVAHCMGRDCGAVTPLDLAGLGAGLELAPLSRLESAIRCTCGARRGSLTVWPEGVPTPETAGRLYLFLA